MTDERRRKNKKATIYDIAKKTGTSTATVSRVLSSSGYPVKEETRKKILKTAKELNYTPNIIGRMLKKNDSRDIGVIIPTISNPFYPQVVLGIEMEARQKGYNILLCNSLRDPAIEKKYIETLYQKQVKGIIISSAGDNGNDEFLQEMQWMGLRIITIDHDIKGIGCGMVGFDYKKGGMIATEYLISCGHRNITFITSPLTRASRRDTMEGYRQALMNNGIEAREENILVGEREEEYKSADYQFESREMMVRIMLQLDEKPSAIFAVNDMTALAAIEYLVNCVFDVPGDISVIGFDNIEVSSMVNPPLTTVHQPAFETGKLAFGMLLESFEDPGANGGEDGHTWGDNNKNRNIIRNTILDPSLVIRKSVAGI